MSELSPVCVRLTIDERAALSALAKAQHRTASDQLRFLIADAASKYFPVKIERTNKSRNTRKMKGVRKR